jgi:hypothetical protein
MTSIYTLFMSVHTVRNPVPTPEEMADILGLEPERAQAVREIMSPVLVERTEGGEYAVKRLTADEVSAVLPTQAEAIKRARELNPNRQPLVERVRNTKSGSPDKWRKA